MALEHPKVRDAVDELRAAGGRASLLVVEGRLGDARNHFSEAIEMLRPLRSLRTLADVLMLRGQVDARLGHLDLAEAAFIEAIECARSSGHRAGEARLRLCIAALDHARGHVQKALATARAAINPSASR